MQIHAYSKKNCGFPMGSNQYLAGRIYDLCVYYMMGTPKGSTESGFMEKLVMEPATPGLQDICLSPTPRRLHCFGAFKSILYALIKTIPNVARFLV